MAITDDLRKTLSDPTPLYFAAGTADLALQQAKKVPGLVDQLRTEAPARIDAVRNADPKAVQDKAATRAKEVQETVQARVNEFIGTLDGDFKKLGESAQDLAMRSVGVAAEYAVRARETYEKVAEHGEQTVRTWRGEAADEIVDLAEVVEPAPRTQPKAAPGAARAKSRPQPRPQSPAGSATGSTGSATAKPAASRAGTAKPAGAGQPAKQSAAKPRPAAGSVPAQDTKGGSTQESAAGKTVANGKKAPARKPAARKTTPPPAQ
ncbi:hypothetical protein [Streptomyces uncialis]|uniref:hypothetical protein n=1 Tax=Streptomyces uncialis TaxID=1048205 RepID=UPI0038641215|nr:hypothetical protein OG268_16935 [Streptomyces uncialis]